MAATLVLYLVVQKVVSMVDLTAEMMEYSKGYEKGTKKWVHLKVVKMVSLLVVMMVAWSESFQVVY